MDAAERKEILSRYMDHQRRFDAVPPSGKTEAPR